MTPTELAQSIANYLEATSTSEDGTDYATGGTYVDATLTDAALLDGTFDLDALANHIFDALGLTTEYALQYEAPPLSPDMHTGMDPQTHTTPTDRGPDYLRDIITRGIPLRAQNRRIVQRHKTPWEPTE